MKRIFSFLTITLALFGLYACGSSVKESSPTPTVLLPTSAPSAAPSPTATLAPTPTVIPTPKLPVAVGTSIPIPSQILSAENVDQVVELARYGNGFITAEAYSPDGKIIAIASTLGVTLYQADGLQETLFIDANAAVNGLAFSSNGAYLAGGLSDDSIKVWNASDGTLFKSFVVPKDETIKNKASPEQVISVAFSPDGSLLASGTTDGTVSLWKVADGSLANTAKDHKTRVSKVFFSLDGQAFFSASWDGTVRMSNVSDGTLIRSFVGEVVIDAEISADGKTLVTYNHRGFTAQGRLNFWEVQSGKILKTIKINYQYFLDITSIALSPDGQFVAAGWNDYSVKIWSVSSGILQNTFQDLAPKGYYNYGNVVVQYSPDGKYLVLAGLNIIGMWNVTNGSMFQNLETKSEPAYTLAISPDGKTLAAVVGLNVHFWQIPDGKVLPFKDQMQIYYSIDYSPDGNSLATVFLDNTAHILPLTAQGISKSFETERKDGVAGVAFSPDGKVLALGVFPKGNIELRQVADGSLLNKIVLGITYNFYGMAFSPNGEFLGLSLTNNIKLLQVSDGKLLKSFKASYGLAFSPDSTLLAAGAADKTVSVWSIPGGKTIFTLKDRPDAVDSVVFSPDGKLLVSGSGDGTIEVFLIPEGTLLKSWKGHSLGISDLVFSPDGKLLISSSYDGTVRFWGLKP